MKIHPQRIQKLNNQPVIPGPIIYWMSRDQRVQDNWALLYAQHLAKELQQPLIVVFCLAPSFLGATQRHYGFMLKGLQYVEEDLHKLSISFVLLSGDVEKELPKFVQEKQVGAVVTDFSPLRIGRQWRQNIAEQISIRMEEVDAHNIVPCWFASNKKEFGAYTIRPKINKLLPEFLTDFPEVAKHEWNVKVEKVNWEKIQSSLSVDETVKEVTWVKPGESAARAMLKTFISEKLSAYDEKRNDPTQDAQSDLSPYLHFGHLSAQRVAYEVDLLKGVAGKAAFLEEIIIRRELADNFCFYNPQYDSFEGFPDWAKKTLHEHRSDRREYLYSREELEYGKTHDDLWNAAQIEMVTHGKMHGYMRMYWAKKILEWTATPEEALAHAIYLNDKYEIDGRDPNGYVGIAWSIGGVHDRPWFKRSIYGMIRYMSENGLKKKFNTKEYIAKWIR